MYDYVCYINDISPSGRSGQELVDKILTIYSPKLPLASNKTEPSWPTFNNDAGAVACVASIAIASDDITGIGVVDDIIIPLVWVGAGTAWVIQNADKIGQAYDYISYHVSSWWDSLFMARSKDPTHDKGARGSTSDKHTNKRPGAPEKKNQKPGWRDRSGYRR
jgi:hypothetical protein